MTRWWTFAAALAVAALLPGLGAAYTCTPTTGCTFNITIPEPTTNTAGLPLTDLASCTASWSKSVDGAAPVAQAPVVVPASKPTGGGTVVKPVTDATAVAPHVYAVQVTGVACTNTGGVQGPPGPASNVLQMTNGVAPSPPGTPTVN